MGSPSGSLRRLGRWSGEQGVSDGLMHILKPATEPSSLSGQCREVRPATALEGGSERREIVRPRAVQVEDPHPRHVAQQLEDFIRIGSRVGRPLPRMLEDDCRSCGGDESKPASNDAGLRPFDVDLDEVGSVVERDRRVQRLDPDTNHLDPSPAGQRPVVESAQGRASRYMMELRLPDEIRDRTLPDVDLGEPLSQPSRESRKRFVGDVPPKWRDSNDLRQDVSHTAPDVDAVRGLSEPECE